MCLTIRFHNSFKIDPSRPYLNYGLVCPRPRNGTLKNAMSAARSTSPKGKPANRCKTLTWPYIKTRFLYIRCLLLLSLLSCCLTSISWRSIKGLDIFTLLQLFISLPLDGNRLNIIGKKNIRLVQFLFIQKIYYTLHRIIFAI